MKSPLKILFAILVAVVAAGSAWAQAQGGSYVDAYSSASETKAFLTGEAFAAAAQALEAGSSDLANLATGKAPGYVAPKSLIGNVMSTNPDGSVGISTISQWAYSAKEGANRLTIQLTYGQNALNIAKAGSRGSLFVPGVVVGGKPCRYMIHFKVAAVEVLPYSDEDFAAGKFNFYYSGKDAKKSQYTLACEILAIEEVSNSVKLSVTMP